jgi:hypothetical protein
MLQRYTRQKSRAHSSQAKKIGREDLATRPIIVQDLWPGFQSDMLNFFHFTRKMLNVKLIKIIIALLINYKESKLGLAGRNKGIIAADIVVVMKIIGKIKKSICSR